MGKRLSFAGNGGQCCGGIFNSLSLTCFSWGEAGGERGWFVSMSARAGRGWPERKRGEKKKKKTIGTHRSKSRRKNKRKSLYGAPSPLWQKWNDRSTSVRNGRASRGAMKLSQVSALARERADPAPAPRCVITHGARARPISAGGSSTLGQSSQLGQAATAWSRACCSRAPSLTRAVIVTSARVANAVDTSWRHGAPRASRTNLSPASFRLYLRCTDMYVASVVGGAFVQVHLFLSFFLHIPWTHGPIYFVYGSPLLWTLFFLSLLFGVSFYPFLHLRGCMLLFISCFVEIQWVICVCPKLYCFVKILYYFPT